MAAFESDSSGMAEFFDFGGISVPEPTISQMQVLESQQFQLDESDLAMPDLASNGVELSSIGTCLAHPFEHCLCDAKVIADFGLDEPECPDLGPDNFENFAAWIPRYSKPDRKCDYCRSKHLECWFTYEGQSTCSPCNALFRACSFSTHTAKPTVVMDTLHTVTEDQEQEQGAFTGIKALKSYDRAAFDDHDAENAGGGRKTGTRFPRAAIKILKEWMDLHADNPYPNDQEKEDLQTLTGLNAKQITDWMANTRRRRKTRARGVSPSLKSPTWPVGTAAMDIPFDKQKIRHNGKTWDIMNPLERWQHSPPQNEPADILDIADAVAKNKADSRQSSLSSSSNGARPGFLSSHGSSVSLRQQQPAPSITSCETGTRQSDSLLSSSKVSSGSLGSSLSMGSRNSRGRDRRRRRRTAANPSKSAKVQEMRPFQCTFCTDRFRTKYDWSRHEKSLHLSLEKWICAPLGPVVTASSSGLKQCVYCGQNDPNEEHIESHNHKSCEEKGFESRIFYRKDHLRQHLRLVHGCKMLDTMDSWKSEATYINSRCGFCKQEFTRWQDRIDHLSKHFRAGAQMKDWKGCRGLDPAVAAQVTNAMPPYLIGNEALSPYPFSASNEATWGQLRNLVEPGNDLEFTMANAPDWDQIIGAEALDAAATTMPDFEGMYASAINTLPQSAMSADGLSLMYHDLHYNFDQEPNTNTSKSPPGPNITCWEILTTRLGMYVRKQIAAGIFPTDEDLQRQARQIIYEDDDSWNQTAADNPEWLELFKKAHNMPSVAMDVRVDFDEDLGGKAEDLNFDGLMFDETTWDILPANNGSIEPASWCGTAF